MKPLLAALALAFSVDAGAAEPPAPSKAAPLAPPALPFRYVGRLLQNGKVEVLLMRGERLYAIAVGEHIGDDYVVERIGSAAISFLYLPLKLKQSMDIPGVN
jgi:hypothetical protein